MWSRRPNDLWNTKYVSGVTSMWRQSASHKVEAKGPFGVNCEQSELLQWGFAVLHIRPVRLSVFIYLFSADLFFFPLKIWPYCCQSARKSWARSLVCENILISILQRGRNKEEMVDRLDGDIRYAVWYQIFLAPEGSRHRTIEGSHGGTWVVRNDPLSPLCNRRSPLRDKEDEKLN